MSEMSVATALLCVGVALLVAMLYAACQQKYRRFVVVFLLAWADMQIAQALVSHARHQTLLVCLNLASGVGLPGLVYYWSRKAGGGGGRRGQRAEPPAA